MYDNFHIFKDNKLSILVYNHYNDAVITKLKDTLLSFNIKVKMATDGEENYLVLFYEVENVTKAEFFNHIRNVIFSVLKKHRIQLVTVDFEDTIGVITSNPKVKPLGLTIKNVPFLNTHVEGDFIARPKTMTECYELIKLVYDDEKLELQQSEFGVRLDNANKSLILSIEKTDRLAIIHSTLSSNVLI